MPRAKKIGTVILKDGTVAGFLVESIKSYKVDLDFDDPVHGEVVPMPHTKIVVSFVLDAGTIKASDYAKGPDPSKPIQFDLHTLLRVPLPVDGQLHKSIPLDKDPSSDTFTRLRFIKYAQLQKILKMSGYQKGKENRFPLKGHIYFMMTKKDVNNYPALKDGHVLFGDATLVESIRKERENLTGLLDEAFDADIADDITGEGEAKSTLDNALDAADEDTTTANDDINPSEEEAEMVREAAREHAATTTTIGKKNKR